MCLAHSLQPLAFLRHGKDTAMRGAYASLRADRPLRELWRAFGKDGYPREHGVTGATRTASPDQLAAADADLLQAETQDLWA